MADDKAPDDRTPIARRNFLLGAGTAVAATLGTPAEAQQSKAGAASVATAPAGIVPAPQGLEPETYLALTGSEVAFLSAVADTFIPADELTSSGTDCGVVSFIDRQLAGAWGGGAKMYRSGPFRKGRPTQGYQLPLTPREFFAAGIVAANAWSRQTHGKEFDRLTPQQRDAALKDLDAGKARLADFDGKQFVDALLRICMEGFFSDPIYGGNRNKVSWKMVGYPGLPAVYATLIEEYRNKRYLVEPQSIADFS